MSTTTSLTTISASPALPVSAAPASRDTVRVERGHRVGLAVTGVVLLALASAGIVAVRTSSSTADAPTAGTTVARTDALESAHGQGATIRTGAGPAVAAAALSTTSAPVVHRTPPRGMVERTAAARTTQRSEGPRGVRRDLSLTA